MRAMTCSFTGHRSIPADKLEYVRLELRREITAAVELGYAVFMSGFADGADLEFAAAVDELKCGYPYISLVAVLPYAGRKRSASQRFQNLLKKCDHVIITSDEYSPDCFAKRNRRLVSSASLLIAVFDGREKSGTAQTLRMAREQDVELRIISVRGG